MLTSISLKVNKPLQFSFIHLIGNFSANLIYKLII